MRITNSSIAIKGILEVIRYPLKYGSFYGTMVKILSEDIMSEIKTNDLTEEEFNKFLEEEMSKINEDEITYDDVLDLTEEEMGNLSIEEQIKVIAIGEVYARKLQKALDQKEKESKEKDRQIKNLQYQLKEANKQHLILKAIEELMNK